jgi:hypothetical protein
MGKIKIFGTMCILCLMFSACGALIQIDIDTYADPSLPLLPNSKIYIFEDLDANNPLFNKEVIIKIKKLLESRKFIVTSNIIDSDNADYILIFIYGIGEKEVDGYGLAYEPSKTTTVSGDVNVNITTPGSLYSYPIKYKANERWFMVRLLESKAYKNWFKKCEDLRNIGTPEEQLPKEPRIWDGSANSIGSSGDLRLVINYLMIPLFDYFGKNTGQIIQITMKEKDPRVKSLNIK